MTITNNNGKLQLECTTPIGRLVQGDCSKPSEKDMHGQPLTVKSGPNIGQPRKEYFTGVAFQKGLPEVEAMRAEWAQFVRQCWPHLFTPDGRCVLPAGISDKWIDGDGYDNQGKAWSTREGFAGHWVLRASSGYAPQLYAAGRYSPADQLQPGSIQLGSYVRENVTVESNLNTQKPGVFVNLRMVELCGMGAPIIRGPDASAAFSQPAGALPPGATAITPGTLPTGAPPPPAAPGAPPPPAAPPPAAPPPAAPVAPHNPIVAAQADGWAAHPTSPGYFYKGQEVLDAAALGARYPAPVAAPPPAAPPAAPGAPGAPPYHGYAQVPGVPAPPAAPAAPMPPPAPPAPIVPAGPIMTAKAGGATYESFKSQGWSDEQMIRDGYMLPGNVQ